MGKKGESQEGGSDDNYLDLMAAVVTQQVEDAYNTKVPKGNAEARRYIFNDESESGNYVFGFKFATRYMKIDPDRARPAIYYRHDEDGGFSAKGGNSPCREKTTSYSFLDIL